MPKAISIFIGNELLNGKTTNSNAAYIGRELQRIGIDIERALVIRDKPDEIIAALHDAECKFDTIIVTGGLGPTADDLTRSAIATFFNCRLIFSNEIYSDIEARFKRSGQSLPLSNKSQAMFPEGAKVLKNTMGTAPGIHFDRGESDFFFLPGVPGEMRSILSEQILPYLQERYNLKSPLVKLFRTTGIAESRLAERCQPFFDRYSQLEIAYLPRFTGVDIRVSSNVESGRSLMAHLEKELRSEIGKYIFEEGDRNLETVLGDALIKKGVTICTAESCTGGLIANRLTDVPGSSAYFLGGLVAYTNDIKMAQLGVKKVDLIKYGAVSEPVAGQMAEGARQLLGATYGLSTTGIAGPDGATTDKPVGLVYIGLSSPEQTVVRRFIFGQDRLLNKAWSAQAALELCRRSLLQLI